VLFPLLIDEGKGGKILEDLDRSTYEAGDVSHTEFSMGCALVWF
jgi:hypothetical protein